MRLFPTLLVIVGLAWSAPAFAGDSGVHIDAGVVGSTVTAWDAFDEAGNAFGLAAGAHVSDFRVTAAFAGVLPDARSRAQFITVWLEGQWHPFREMTADRALPLSPYALLGLGVAAGDDAGDGPDSEGVRWGSDGAEFVGMLGVGVRYGPPSGLYVALDLRGYNVSHAGVALSAGWVF
ncbi:MAG: hypothetical protein ACQEXJ_04555 [Myxococcota bacterium]